MKTQMLLQHWILLLEHHRPRHENSNAVASLPVPMGNNCVYDTACDSHSPFHFE